MRKLLKSVVRGHRNRRNLRLGLKSRDPFVITRELVGADAALIFDVGAHIGLAASRYRELFPQAKIHCFEPFPESFAALEEAAARLGQIELHPVAVASSEGQAEFSVNENPATNSLLASDASGEVYWRRDTPRTKGKLIVPTIALDSFVSERAIEHIDILKMDVQGGEYDALKGMQESLGGHVIGLVYMELIVAPTYIGQHRMHDYLELFDEAGYVLFDFYNLGRGNGRLLQADVIFTSPELMARFEQRLTG